jgi:hypothetical protein
MCKTVVNHGSPKLKKGSITQCKLAEYCSTYSGLAGIKLFLKMSKSKEIKREDERQKIGGNSITCFLPIRHCRASIQYLTTFFYPTIW